MSTFQIILIIIVGTWIVHTIIGYIIYRQYKKIKPAGCQCIAMVNGRSGEDRVLIFFWSYIFITGCVFEFFERIV